MHTSDVRIDTALNHFLWSRGCRNVPRKVRIRVSRTQNEEDDAKEKFYRRPSATSESGEADGTE